LATNCSDLSLTKTFNRVGPAVVQHVHRALVLKVDYLTHHPRGRWQVYDLHIDGISLVTNYRAPFNKIIRTSSDEALMTTLPSRQAEFTAPGVAGSGVQSAR
jgi:ABC-type transporter MlaC component